MNIKDVMVVKAFDLLHEILTRLFQNHQTVDRLKLRWCEINGKISKLKFGLKVNLKSLVKLGTHERF